MEKVNCWEFMKCGKAYGECPVTTETRLHQIHGGVNAGRACWVVAGSLCGGVAQGTFSKKFGNCSKCDFYNHVKREEHVRFELTPILLKKLSL